MYATYVVINMEKVNTDFKANHRKIVYSWCAIKLISESS